MSSRECPGLPAEWLNAWLAAVGATVLAPGLGLSWSSSASPHAVLHVPGGSDPLDLLLDAWPTKERIGDLPIAEGWQGLLPMRRTVPLPVFQSRARLGRSHPDIWTLSSTVTDLYLSGDDSKQPPKVEHSKLDPAGPGTVKWLHHRLERAHQGIEDPVTWISDCFAGRPNRVDDYGLGFDIKRVTSLADNSRPRTDPVIETLAFFGLRLFPLRGSGVASGQSTESWHSQVRQRSWHLDPEDNRRKMMWPAWNQTLRMSGIDALLDIWNPWRRHNWRLLGVHGAWQSVEYQSRGDRDNTRAIGSQSL